MQKDYFAPNTTFPDDPWFRRRFRMREPLFLCIVEGVEAHDDYFKITRDSAANFLSLLSRNARML